MDTVRLIDHVIDEARVINTDHVPSREHISFHRFTFLYLLLDEETLEILDVDHYLKTHKIKTIQETFTDPLTFEVDMLSTLRNSKRSDTYKLVLLRLLTYTRTTKRHDNASRFEIAFRLDSGASISVLNYPLNITCNDTTNQVSKTLNSSNQTEVPILQHVTLL